MPTPIAKQPAYAWRTRFTSTRAIYIELQDTLTWRNLPSTFLAPLERVASQVWGTPSTLKLSKPAILTHFATRTATKCTTSSTNTEAPLKNLPFFSFHTDQRMTKGEIFHNWKKCQWPSQMPSDTTLRKEPTLHIVRKSQHKKKKMINRFCILPKSNHISEISSEEIPLLLRTSDVAAFPGITSLQKASPAAYFRTNWRICIFGLLE